jgi:hypothetical protein
MAVVCGCNSGLRGRGGLAHRPQAQTKSTVSRHSSRVGDVMSISAEPIDRSPAVTQLSNSAARPVGVPGGGACVGRYAHQLSAIPYGLVRAAGIAAIRLDVFKLRDAYLDRTLGATP